MPRHSHVTTSERSAVSARRRGGGEAGRAGAQGQVRAGEVLGLDGEQPPDERIGGEGAGPMQQLGGGARPPQRDHRERVVVRIFRPPEPPRIRRTTPGRLTRPHAAIQ